MESDPSRWVMCAKKYGAKGCCKSMTWLVTVILGVAGSEAGLSVAAMDDLVFFEQVSFLEELVEREHLDHCT